MKYVQATGNLYDGTGTLMGNGYSGHGKGLNNPAMQQVSNVGPIPAGYYAIGHPYDSPHVGPFALPLIPNPANEMFNRGGLRMHGDEKEHAGEFLASHGCIIMSRAVREAVSEVSLGEELRVVAHETD